MPSASPSTSPVRYRERLYLPFGWWAGVVVMVGLLAFELVPILPVHPALTLAIPLAAAVLALAVAGRTRVEVTDDLVRAGGWSIDCSQVASVEELDQRNTRRFAGPSGDPAAVSVVRPWVRTAVRVICVSDEPPFALISSRHPERLSAAIVACATTAADQHLPER